ncbi:HAD family hydrolase [Actinomycetospora termitidis]|uniref:HAD hydrolase-like protein n=1 Tax=Actinomycetospora termitidis TaxID=3053470 RepID=A0ABT7MIE6_9PSEU|nr:HAD hydrolase-like protein [Actinomycetospora sp. Odt1-22]MDL5159717.1 HAD hydrolase-like protein [Actinomycetospora sp. Odt1-22]
MRAVVFDLDGTLVQTRIASWEVFEPINRRHGLGVDTPQRYFDLFRGNVFSSIREVSSTEAQASAATADFLAALRSQYAPPLVPGMHAVVRRLASQCTLAVMSSNAMEVLRRVLVDNDLAYCFAHVFGGDVAPDKRAALRSFLADAGSGYGRRCSADYDEAGDADRPDAATTVLVTDTAGDVRDAREVGVRVVGVSWGMHSARELTEAGAEFVALWPQEVLSHLLGDEAAREPTGACAVPQQSSTDCGCGCSTSGAGAVDSAQEGPGERRRRRRREAVAATSDGTALTPDVRTAPLARPSGPTDDLLDAMRRICGG